MIVPDLAEEDLRIKALRYPDGVILIFHPEFPVFMWDGKKMVQLQPNKVDLL